MSLFEHISVAIALITSFIIIRLLEGLGCAWSPSPGTKRYAPFTLWLVVFLISSAIVWWAVWSFEHVKWNLLSFLLILALPCSGFMVASVAVPSSPDAVADWKEHFFRIKGRLFFFAILIQIVYSSCTYFLLDLPLSSPRRVWALANVALYAVAARTSSDWIQTVVPCIYLALFLVAGILFYLAPGSAGAP